MPTSLITRVDVAVRIVTLLLLLISTTAIQIFVIPTFAAVYDGYGLSLPLSARLAIGTLSFLGNPVVMLVLVGALGYMLWKRWGDAQLRVAAVALAALFFALVLIGQASLLVDLAIKGVTFGAVG